jgi:hypothetical protein
MAAPPSPPPVVVPAINKTYSDIRFFVKNAETTRAFAEKTFTGTVDGYLQPDGTTRIVYPNSTFNNTNTGAEPFIDLPTLSTNYRITAPVYLGDGGIEDGAGNIVTAVTLDMFEDIEVDTYILYRESGASTADNLKVLGYVQTKTDDNEVILSENVPVILEGLELELFSWTGPDNAEFLNTLNFNFQDSFYMVVKNVDYTASSGNHDAVLLIDVDRTSTNYTNSPQPFAYSADRIINPTYFSIERITKVYKPTTLEETVVTVPCTIKGISKWSEKSMFDTLTSVPTNKIPFWSVYEITPYGTSTTHLDMNTFYRVTINDSLPSSKVAATAVPVD